MTKTYTATYTKLNSGDWGIRVPSLDKIKPGSSVRVRTKSGEVKMETVEAVLWSGDSRGEKVHLCSIRKTPAPAQCRPNRPSQPLNNPAAVPQKMEPVTDVAAECEKHGRKSVGEKSVPFYRPSSRDEKSVIGESFWGRADGKRGRYLIVRCGVPQYRSADSLEDNDQFDLRAGYYRWIEAIEVEPTEEEKANDPAVAKAKAEARDKRRGEIERLVQRGHTGEDPRSYRSATAGLVKLWGNTVFSLHVSGDHLVFIMSSSDDWATWEITDAALAAEALLLR